jgi:hypothetical protein
MVLLIDYLSSFFNCERNDLARILRNNSTERIRLINKLHGKTVRTTYSNRAGQFATFEFYGLTLDPSSEQYAYNGFLRTTVQQHYYSRHRLRLRYPLLPCVIERNVSKRRCIVYKFYPIELLEVDFNSEDETFDYSGTIFFFNNDDPRIQI